MFCSKSKEKEIIVSIVKFLLIMFATGCLLACGGGGSESPEESAGEGRGDGENQTPTEPAEPRLTPNFQDALLQQFIQGEPVRIELINTGVGGLTDCSTSDLPIGLDIRVSIDSQNCLIEGDALGLLEQTDIEITATNAAGSTIAILPLRVDKATPLIVKVRAEASQGSGQRTFTIRHNPSFIYDYTVDWGDGSELDSGNGSEDLVHTYSGDGNDVFTITITGLYPHLSLFRTIRPEDSIVSIEQWGNQPWKSLESAFSNVHNLEINALDLPNLNHTSTLSKMFLNAAGFNNDLSQWNVSNVSDMSDMLSGTQLPVELYDLLLNGWASLQLQEGVAFGAGESQFSDNGRAARTILSDNFLWDITDAGDAVPELTTSVNLIKLYTNLDAEFAFKNSGVETTDCESSGLPLGVFVVSSNGTCKLEGTPEDLTETLQASVTAINEFGRSTIDFSVQVVAETPFVTRWKTDNEGETDSNSITIYTSNNFDYKFTVDWGDGQIDTDVTDTIVHTYEAPGEYDVSISGRYPQPHFPNNDSDAPKLISVESWGERPWLSMKAAFKNAKNLSIENSSEPDLSRVTDMSNMFQSASGFNSDISHWDVSNIETMAALFAGARAFNQNIGTWDVSNVRLMSSMFSNATAFNQDIGNWDVRNVQSMRFMFNFAQNFNQPIGTWVTSSLKDMRALFRAARKFNQPIADWQTSLVTTMEELFDGAVDFNQPIGTWDTSAVKNMRKTFNIASDFNQDISSWDVSNVNNMNIMFKQAGSFNQDISSWDVSNVVNMDNMFEKANQFDQNLAQWNIQSVEGTQVFNRTFSTENYDAMLNAWSLLEGLKQGVTLELGDSVFSPSSEAAKATLINNFGWTINDGGVSGLE
jgi:surface protein